MNFAKPYTLILASQSPRRLQILQEHNIQATVQPANILEVRNPSESPQDYVLRLSKEKAYAILNRSHFETATIILAADTTVALGNEILEKPTDAQDAFRMLKALSDKTHAVFTGYTLLFVDESNRPAVRHEISECIATTVQFRPLTEKAIQDYIDSKDPFDKAGAYGIQSVKETFVQEMSGSYFNVMGLPIEAILKHLP